MPFIFVFRAWENIFYTTLLVHGRLTKAQTSSSSFEEHPRKSLFSSERKSHLGVIQSLESALAIRAFCRTEVESILLACWNARRICNEEKLRKLIINPQRANVKVRQIFKSTGLRFWNFINPATPDWSRYDTKMYFFILLR
jgi:hypothetical protein